MESINPKWNLGYIIDGDMVDIAVYAGETVFPLQVSCPVDSIPERFIGLEPRRYASGISATALFFRKALLPFVGKKQIEAVLPQDFADRQLTQVFAPHFASYIEPEQDGSQVLYAVAESDQIKKQVDFFRQLSLEPEHLLVIELASWPLLLASGAIFAADGPVLIADFSVSPASLLLVEGDQLLGFSVVSKAAVEAGGDLLSSEVCWLRDELCASVDVAKTVFLGEKHELESLQFDAAELFDFEELGLNGWRWVRPAGLAIAGSQREWYERLFDFRSGELAYSSPVRQWVTPWAGAGASVALLLVCFLVWAQFKQSSLDTVITRLVAETASLFNAALPGTPMIDPVQQLQRAYSDSTAESGMTLTQMLSLLQQELKGVEGVTLQRLSYENGSSILSGLVPSYALLEQVRLRIEGTSGISSVKLLGAKEEASDGLILFRLKVET